MQQFPSLYRKTLLNYVSGWKFILSIHKYPIIVYVNLHNINNNSLHQIKHYMSVINGSAQVLSTQQLGYLFNGNIKFKFMITGNIVALTFENWQNVWDFNIFQKKWALLISTISINGLFLNLGADSTPLDSLQDLFKQNENVMIKLHFQLSCTSMYIYSYLVQSIIIMINLISFILYKIVQIINSLSYTISHIAQTN